MDTQNDMQTADSPAGEDSLLDWNTELLADPDMTAEQKSYWFNNDNGAKE